MSAQLYQSLFTVKKNQVQMLMDRGFNVGDEEYMLNYTLDQFIDSYAAEADRSGATIKSLLGKFYEKEDDHVSVIYLETPIDKAQVGKAQIVTVMEGIQETGITHIMLISAVNLTPDSRKIFDKIPSYRVETFLYEDLMYNPTKHFLVPQHRIMAPDEVAQLKIELNKSPLISMYDPIARYYGAVHGDVMEILRLDLTGIGMVNRSVFYRVVIDRALVRVKPKAKPK